MKNKLFNRYYLLSCIGVFLVVLLFVLIETGNYSISNVGGADGSQIDTWNECEEAIGFTVYNPLETLDWLNKTGCFGMESTDPSMPEKHVQAIPNP